MPEEPRCPICQDQGTFAVVERVGNSTILECPGCGLRFTHPLLYSQDYYENDYYAANPGVAALGQAGRRGLIRHARQIHAVLVAPVVALERLRQILPPGSPVLDIGCGSGLFLALLEEAGFLPIGSEMARQPVAMLTGLGFQVHGGDIGSYPQHWPRPKAITIFEVIEHLANPVGFLAEIHSRFPEAMLILSTPSPRSWARRIHFHPPWDYPPYHLTRWSDKSLKAALARAGYHHVELMFPKMNSREVFDVMLSSMVARALGVWEKGKRVDIQAGNGGPQPIGLLRQSFWPLAGLRGFLGGIAAIGFWPVAAVGNMAGASHLSMLALARP